MKEDMPSFFDIIKEEAEFNPRRIYPIYYLFSKKINEKIKVEMDAIYQIYFTCNNNPQLSFRVHELEFNDKGEWLYWQKAALDKKEAEIKGLYTMFGNFYGSINTKDHNLELITKKNRIVKMRTSDEKTKYWAPLIYGFRDLKNFESAKTP